MLVATSVANDARVLKEARALRDAGHKVHIFGRDVPADFALDGVEISGCAGSSVLRKAGSDSLGAKKLNPAMKALRWALLPMHRQSAFRRWGNSAIAAAKSLEFDIVHAHDFTALAPAAAIANEAGAGYVYDSHEFWQGMTREYRPTPILDLIERRTEARLGSAALGRITVGDQLAQRLRSCYGWDDIVVVRNSFPEFDNPPPVAETPQAAVYAGRLGAHRELETVAAASMLVELPIQLVGPADATWLSGFDAKRSEILPEVPASEVAAVVAKAGISLVTLADSGDNHRLALPNKIFQAVQAGVPVVASRIGEIEQLTTRYGLGECYQIGSPQSLAEAIAKVTEGYDRYRANTDRARSELSWRSDASRLCDLYARLERLTHRE